MENNKIRVRYAPSPTGFFHVGGARTALFNYLFAKHNNGKFIVRIEDTDIERNVEGGIDSQISNINWLGIKIDESIKEPGNFGPYIQSQKIERYKQLAYQLVKQKKAYYCFCTKQELDHAREEAIKKGLTPKYNRHCLNLTDEEIKQKLRQNIPYTIRLKINDNENIEWDDIIRGKITVPTSALTDPIILKSNGFPMYNFAVVIDDYDMKITHVIRGEEHISNTPYQIAIKNALDFNDIQIRYGHLSVITDANGKKLSKRDKTLKQFIQDYKDMGFYPFAITNFLALLGWSPIDNNEIMSIDEMIKKFDINHVSKNPTFFDVKKMEWVSNKYINKLSNFEYLSFVKKYINTDLLNYGPLNDEVILLFKKQISYAKQLNHLINETFNNFKIEKINEYKRQFSKNWVTVVNLLYKLICDHKNTSLTFNDAKTMINNIAKLANVKGMDLFMPIRLLITNAEHGPELYKIITILGVNETKKRLEYFLK